MSEKKKSLNDFYEMSVKTIMEPWESEACCITEDDRVNTVFSFLDSKDHIWVTNSKNNKQLVGIITQSDMIALISPPLTSLQTFDKPDPRSLQFGIDLTAGEIMSKKPVTVPSDETVKNILLTMKEQRIKQIPIVDEKNQPIGEITLGHLIIEYSKHLVQNLEISPP